VKREQPDFREEGLWPALMIGLTFSHVRPSLDARFRDAFAGMTGL
jgi:hypothetical protein